MTTAPQCAHPLKGIICTNEDPTRCFACSGLMHRDEGFIHCCCGAMICDNCKLKADQSSTGGYDPCVLCHGNWASIKALKKHAKRGSAWAQHALGKGMLRGEPSSKNLTRNLSFGTLRLRGRTIPMPFTTWDVSTRKA